MSLIGSIAEPDRSSSSLTASDLNDMLKKQAIDKENTEINIKENGPHSESDTDPQTCVEKTRATDEPVNAPMEPPALIIPK
jgi:hypothetical protein